MAQTQRNVLMSDIHIDEIGNAVVLHSKSEEDVSSLWTGTARVVSKRNTRMCRE